MDLLPTDINGCSVQVMTYIADHNDVLVKWSLPEMLENSVWLSCQVDWKEFMNDLSIVLGTSLTKMRQTRQHIFFKFIECIR